MANFSPLISHMNFENSVKYNIKDKNSPVLCLILPKWAFPASFSLLMTGLEL